MTYSTTAALAFPLLLAFSPAPVETIKFSPKAGTAVTKSFVTTTELELDDADIRMGGNPMPIEGMEMNQKAVQSVTVTDEYGDTADGRMAKLTRTYDAIGMESDTDMVMGMQQSMSGAGTSGLEGKTVVFQWNEEEDEYDTKFKEGEKGDAKLLEELTFGMDLVGLLPAEEIEVGASYDIEPGALEELLAPGGNMGVEMEMDGAQGGMPGMDQGQTGDLSHFFQEALDGSATGKLKEVRDSEGVRLAVIELNFDVLAVADLTEAMGDMGGGELPPGMDISVDRMEMEMTYVGKGEMLWNLTAGHVHSIKMEGDITINMDMAMTMNGEMEMTTAIDMAGKAVTSVTTE